MQRILRIISTGALWLRLRNELESSSSFRLCEGSMITPDGTGSILENIGEKIENQEILR